jgi:hypothetical protein
VLRYAYGELKPNTFIPRKKRKVSMGGGGADDFDSACGFQGAKRADQILIDIVEKLAKANQPLPPEVDNGKQVSVTCACQGGWSLVAGLDTLLEKCLHFRDEYGTDQLVREYGSKPDRNWGGHCLRGQTAENLEQRQIGVERGLTDPVTAVRPPPVVEDIRQMAVQCKDEICLARGHRAPGA